MEELNKAETLEINGGSARPGPSTIGIGLYVMAKTWIDGFMAGSDIF